MGLMLSHYQEWAESHINLIVQLPLSLKKETTADNPLRKISPNTEKNIAAIQYYVNIFRSICHSDLETHVFWHSYLWKQYC